MAAPSYSDYTIYTGTKLTNTDWNTNLHITVNYLTDGTSDFTINSLTTTADVDVGNDLSVGGDFAVTGSQTATELVTTYGFYHPRGSVTAFDYSYPTFVNTNTWTDLDLSSILPINTKAVHITGRIYASLVNCTILFRAKGETTNTFCLNGAIGSVISTYIYYTVIVAVDTNRVIQYKNDGVGGVNDIVITGWWK